MCIIYPLNGVTLYEMNKKPSLIINLVLLIGILGCESRFEPLEESDEVFSMFGVLDLHADTQWVRIMPIGESFISRDTAQTDVRVTLINMASGERVELNDSLFQFSDAYAWNYWTPYTLSANQEYKIIATAADGRQSSVDITIPSALPEPEVEYSTERESGAISGSSVPEDSLVLAQMKYRVQPLNCAYEATLIFSYADTLVRMPDGRYRFEFSHDRPIAEELKVPQGAYRLNMRRLIVATASEDWPNLSELTEYEVALPISESNIKNGTGLVPGISRRIIDITPPRERCYPF